jgi:hypothetical protein
MVKIYILILFFPKSRYFTARIPYGSLPSQRALPQKAVFIPQEENGIDSSSYGVTDDFILIETSISTYLF